MWLCGTLKTFSVETQLDNVCKILGGGSKALYFADEDGELLELYWWHVYHTKIVNPMSM